MRNAFAKSFAYNDSISLKWRWTMFAMFCIAAQAVLWAISEPEQIFSDFYKAYYPAGELILNEGFSAAWPFREEEAAVSFVNLPIVAWLFTPFAAFGEETAGYLFLAVGGAAVVATLALFRRVMSDPHAILFVFVLFTLNGPLVNSLREGNTTHFILLMLVVSVLLLGKGAGFSAGAVLGACAVLKLPLLLLGMYFVLTRQWKVVGGAAMSISATVAVSLLVFGLTAHVDWYNSCIQPFLGKVIPAFNVQSLDGFLMRLATGVALLQDWTPHEPGLYHKLARYPILIALFVAAVVAILREGQGTAATPGVTKGFAIVLTLALVLSPLSWSHYYLLLLLPFGLYYSGLLSLPNDAATRWLMTGAVVLTSLPVINLMLSQDWLSELVARTVVSLPFFGAVMLLVALIRSVFTTQATPHA